MEHDPSPLTYLGTQSRDTVNLDTAIALRNADHPGRDLPVGAGHADGTGSTLGDAAAWARDKAGAALGSAAHGVGRIATSALGDYTRKDPVRAMLIAAGAGALAMTLVARLARSGARKVRRGFGAS